MQSANTEKNLQLYYDFREKVSQEFSRIQKKFPSSFSCQSGCHSCCKASLSVNALEAYAIQQYLLNNPGVKEKIRTRSNEEKHFWKGKRCDFLNKEGNCSIYEARPIVCRSHGAPLQFKENDNFETATRLRDVCELNFLHLPIETLAPSDVLNLDTINTLLALLVRKFLSEKTAEENISFSERTVLTAENFF